MNLFIIRTTRVLLLLLLFFCPSIGPSKADTNSENSDPADAIVSFSVPQGADLVDAVQNLANISSVPINVEVIHVHDLPAELYVPGFVLPPRSYHIGDILRNMQSADHVINWTVDGRTINIIITLSGRVSDPFGDEIQQYVGGNQTLASLVSELEVLDPTSGLVFAPPDAGLIGIPAIGETTRVVLNEPSGTLMRTILNRACEAAGFHWIAFVMDTDAMPVPTLRGKKGPLSWKFSVYGRTIIWFSQSMKPSLPLKV